MEEDWLAHELLRRGLLTPAQLQDASSRASTAARPLGDVLVEMRLLTAFQVEAARKQRVGRVPWCARCGERVTQARDMPDGPACPRCLRPVEWTHARIEGTPVHEVPRDVEAAIARAARSIHKYVLVSEIARGGMGAIHKAWDLVLGEFVALKLLRPDAPQDALGRNAQMRELLREARAAMHLRHPNIVAMRDVGLARDEIYIAMEYIDGRTLGDHIATAWRAGTFSCFYDAPRRWLRVMRDVARAVHYAHTHRRPVIHCDLKPANILVAAPRVPYVLDFGLAHLVGTAFPNDEFARGTPSYMAPEQIRGHPPISVRTDVYGLGTILYELLTGRAPFEGDTATIMASTLSSAPPQPRETVRASVPAAVYEPLRDALDKLDAICVGCLEKAPDDRTESARDVAAEIEKAIDLVPSRAAETR